MSRKQKGRNHGLPFVFIPLQFKGTGKPLSKPGMPMWSLWAKFRVHDPDTVLAGGLTYLQAWAELRKLQDGNDATRNRYPYQYGVRSDLSPNWDVRR